MLTLCQTTGYALLALRELQSPGGTPTLARDIAERTGIPPSYLAKIIHRLGETGLVQTKRGHKGGIVLARPPEQISLLQVSEAINPNDWKTECLFGLTDCRQLGECPLHNYWHEVRHRLHQDLAQTSLADLPKIPNPVTAECPCPPPPGEASTKGLR